MNDWMPMFAVGATMAGIGLLVGFVYFSLLQYSVASVTAGAGPLHALALLIARLALAATFFIWTVRFGGEALVFALAGFLIARTLLTRPRG